MANLSDFSPGMVVYYLWDYNLEKVTVVSVGRKNVKIKVDIPSHTVHEKCVKPEKLALPDESIIVVWETWRGVNGRGGHRIERDLYPQYRQAAKTLPRQRHNIWEKSMGVLNDPGRPFG